VITGVEVEELRELPFDGFDVCSDLFLAEKGAFLRFAARIADQPGAAASQRDGCVPPTLEARQRQERQQVPDVQATALGSKPI